MTYAKAVEQKLYFFGLNGLACLAYDNFLAVCRKNNLWLSCSVHCMPVNALTLFFFLILPFRFPYINLNNIRQSFFPIGLKNSDGLQKKFVFRVYMWEIVGDWSIACLDLRRITVTHVNELQRWPISDKNCSIHREPSKFEVYFRNLSTE